MNREPHLEIAMTLDFHISADEEKAAKELPVFSLSENMHTQLFLRARELRQLPQLGRMSDFYQDASYGQASLAALLQELRQVIPLFSGRPQMQAILQQLAEVSQTAISQGKNVYVFCD